MIDARLITKSGEIKYMPLDRVLPVIYIPKSLPLTLSPYENDITHPGFEIIAYEFEKTVRLVEGDAPIFVYRER